MKMNTSKAAFSGEESLAFRQMCLWFNGWLGSPLSDREKMLLGEMLWYQRYKDDVCDRYAI